jgi:hypothetical protein
MQQFANLHPWQFGFTLVAYVAAMMTLAQWSISRVTGWHRLAERYRFEGEMPEKRWRWRSGRMRWTTRYGNCLNFSADQRGLYMSVVAFFRPFHPPLFIPWNEIEVGEKSLFFIPKREFILGRQARIPLWISTRLGEEILACRPENFLGFANSPIYVPSK